MGPEAGIGPGSVFLSRSLHLCLQTTCPLTCSLSPRFAALPVQAAASDSWRKAVTAFSGPEPSGAEVSVRTGPCSPQPLAPVWSLLKRGTTRETPFLVGRREEGGPSWSLV